MSGYQGRSIRSCLIYGKTLHYVQGDIVHYCHCERSEAIRAITQTYVTEYWLNGIEIDDFKLSQTTI
jgi:hypothetical protein